MIALLTYPTPIDSTSFQKRTENESFSHQLCELHGVIADPASEAGDVKNAKLSLLRTLRKSRSSNGPSAAATSRHPEACLIAETLLSNIIGAQVKECGIYESTP
jgi:hypothetical protein